MSNVIYVNDADFSNTVLNADKPVLLDFWAETCPPCKAIAPILDELADELFDKVIIAKMNVHDNPQVPAQFGIRAVPTLMIFKNGEVADTLVGGQSKANLVNFLNQHC
ncbi:MAG: thioredoxin [Gammaproteobacteria bacterium]|nr:thioredoxin [Gammaproteobacteria bacterium]